MKTNVSQAELNKAISIVSRAVSNRSSLPVLDNILISADGSSLTLVATNLHIGMRCSINLIVEESQIILSAGNQDGDGQVSLDADIEGPELTINLNVTYLLDMLSKLDQPKITMEFTNSNRPIAAYPTGLDKSESLNVIMPMHPKGN